MFQQGKHYKSKTTGIIYECITTSKQFVILGCGGSTEGVYNHNDFQRLFVEYEPPLSIEQWFIVRKNIETKRLYLAEQFHTMNEAERFKEARKNFSTLNNNPIVGITSVKFTETNYASQ